MATNTATTYTTSISTTGTNSNNICFGNTTTTGITGQCTTSNTKMDPTIINKMVSFLELEEDFNKKKEPEVDPETKSTITKNQRNNLVANFYEDGFKKNCSYRLFLYRFCRLKRCRRRIGLKPLPKCSKHIRSDLRPCAKTILCADFSKENLYKTKKVVSRQPNLLLNLKSNTMKNTVQKYCFFL